jgi:23S rRNA (cytosine1962-C5)-methyltransferase
LKKSAIAFKVNNKAEKAIAQGHPWVYSNSIIKQSKSGVAGDISIIFKQSNNKLLAVGLYDPESPIRIKLISINGSVTLDYNFIQNTIVIALSKRKELLRTDTNAYRLIYGENDGLPGLIVDIYDNVAVIKLYSPIWNRYLVLIQQALIKVLPLECIVLRLSRSVQDQNEMSEGVIFGALKSDQVTIKEHGITFKVDPLLGHKTGCFLDHRHNRLNIRNLSQSKTVLDVFSYAGGFSVNALHGGAQRVTSVDISKHALELARQNILLNINNPNHQTICHNAFDVLTKLAQNGDHFDIVIIDPPSFAKSQNEVSKAIHSYKKLVRLGTKLVSKNGILMMASCSSRIKKTEFFDLVIQEVKYSTRNYKILQTTAHDTDHPEGIPELSYLKSIYIQID